jgi:hypothetical protein
MMAAFLLNVSTNFLDGPGRREATRGGHGSMLEGMLKSEVGYLDNLI